jgi:hypothetical protein
MTGWSDLQARDKKRRKDILENVLTFLALLVLLVVLPGCLEGYLGP